MNDMNMRNFIILAASALLLVSCNKNEADLSIYEGEYAVDSATVITMNGNQVSLADYSNAAIRISATTGAERLPPAVDQLWGSSRQMRTAI